MPWPVRAMPRSLQKVAMPRRKNRPRMISGSVTRTSGLRATKVSSTIGFISEVK